MLFGNEKHNIVVQTRKGRDIDNQQFKEITPFELNQLHKLDKYRKDCTFRSGVSPIYNCHGMTFASRRTGIFELDSLKLIISDDGYEEVAQANTLPGDVAIYQEGGDIQHSGIVVEIRNRNISFPVPWICSKWGKGPEVIHAFFNCPYKPEGIKFYRIKSWNPNTDSI